MPTEDGTQPAPLSGVLLVFLKIGATGFGGWMCTLGMMETELVQKRGWVSPQSLSDGITLAQVLPGPIAIDTVAYIGYRLHRWPGATLSVVAFVLPSFLMVLALTLLYLQYGSLPQMAGTLKGIGAAVVALVVATAYRMGRNALRDAWSAIILVGAAIAIGVFSVNIVVVIVAAGAAGFLLYRNGPAPGEAGGRGARRETAEGSCPSPGGSQKESAGTPRPGQEAGGSQERPVR